MLLTALWANSQVTAVGACMCPRGFVLPVKLKGEVWGSSAGPVLEPVGAPLGPGALSPTPSTQAPARCEGTGAAGHGEALRLQTHGLAGNRWWQGRRSPLAKPGRGTHLRAYTRQRPQEGRGRLHTPPRTPGNGQEHGLSQHQDARDAHGLAGAGLGPQREEAFSKQGAWGATAGQY